MEILVGVATALLICFCFYILTEIRAAKKGSAQIERQLEIASRHAQDWKDLALSLTERGLLFRELPLLKEDIEAISRPPRETESDEEKTLEELQAEMDDLSQTMDFSSQGELGERRRLARAIALKRRDSDLKTKSELATESSENVFGSEEDLNHLRSN